MISKKITFLILLSCIITNTAKGDFKKIKKKAIINKPEIIFPIQKLNKKITPKEILKVRKEFRSSVLVRNIYSEVLNIIQPIVIYKLKKNRNKRDAEYLNDALLTSIAGISAAMKNTG